MAVGAIIENMSGRKLAMIGAVLLLCQMLCFLIGAIVSPQPNGIEQVLATKCYDKDGGKNRLKWFWSRKPGACAAVDYEFHSDATPSKRQDLTAQHVVFTFQMPLPRWKINLQFSRWQQSLMGIMTLHIEYEKNVKRDPRVPLILDARLGYRNKKDKNYDWKEYDKSTVARNLDCNIEQQKKDAMREGYHYDCSPIPLFELGSLHHDFYLVNIRLPSVFLHENGTVIDINDKLGKLVDVSLVAIYQNGGFTKVWVGLKTIFFPIVVAEMIWFWRRITLLSRESTLLEKMLMALGIALTFLNVPLEYLTLQFDMPWINLFNDLKQGVFYAMLMVFWMVFAGEHMMNDTHAGAGEKNGLVAYWKKLGVVLFGCLCLFLFDICERGVQLQNSFHSIWVSDVGTNFALGFIILAGISAGLYFLFLCYMIFKVFTTISEKQAAISAMSRIRRLHYQGIIWRFKFLMLATLMTAAMTAVGFILGQVSDGQQRGLADEEHGLEYNAGFMTGVYGMWNIYIFGLLFLYAPSHKRWSDERAADGSAAAENTGEEIEFTVQSGASILTADPSELSSLTEFLHQENKED